jgi:hypothetical protein
LLRGGDSQRKQLHESDAPKDERSLVLQFLREREREGRLTRRDKLPAYTRVICDAARRFIRPINVAAVCHITHRAECCLILSVSKMDVRLNFETDVRDKFQGGIWRVCLKSNARVRYFFALSR